MSKSRKLHLNLFVYPGGHHEAAWRRPEAESDRVLDISFYQQLAQKAEAAKFDALFFADTPALADDVRYATRFFLEPLTWIAAIAPVTRNIGVVATASTTYTEPYALARILGSLDHLSNGRAGWNIVTTGAAVTAKNFQLQEHPNPAERYERAREYLEVISKLWDSWEDDAIVNDRENGVFADTSKIHQLLHDGKYYKVQGALNLPRSPQGRPVFVQAGASADGKAFAGQYAEAVFAAYQSFEAAKRGYADLKAHVVAAGRDPNHVKILPGLSAFIGSTDEEAQRFYDELSGLIQPEYAVQQLKRFVGLDLSGYPLDEPVPAHLISEDAIRGRTSRMSIVANMVREKSMTVRELLRDFGAGRGHDIIIGGPEKIADHIQHWFENGAADGFSVMPPCLSNFDLFVEHVVPILQKRGLFRTEYEGTTLRENLGVPRPDSSFSSPPAMRRAS